MRLRVVTLSAIAALCRSGRMLPSKTGEGKGGGARTHGDTGGDQPESSPIKFRKPCSGMVEATQCAILLALGVTILFVLFFDSRLYYGIDVDGKPIYQEIPRPAVNPGDTVSAKAAIILEGAEGEGRCAIYC